MLARLRAASALGRSVTRRHIGGFAAPADASAPTVAEKVVNVTLIDYEGNRHFIQGRQGQTLRQACEMNNVSLIKDDSNGGGGVHSAVRADYYTESLFGEGAFDNYVRVWGNKGFDIEYCSTSPQSHVIVSNEWISKLPSPNDQELHILQYVPEEDRSANSRLGTEIILDKSLDGLVVAVPEAPPVETYTYVHEYEDDEEEE